ncbi:GNAT family N-acetyltransferase [Shewanella colwelliana]|uniref:GNAT family N-acetyltransferase n=1 Tax=Shewanella colwelliana TaxID=23 RepID=UPI00299CDDE2|nr:GNAT family N-acetyltransferase [Shewanella colwelliana]MDX1281070.1 GNAT family N-acetyltransferase [Shewanella colwelliana]
MKFILDDLTGDAIAQLLQQHLEEMYSTSPSESVHALDLSALKQPCIRFWSLWDNEQLAGCGALKRLSHNHFEIKSMRIAQSYRQQGLGAKILYHLVADAAQQGGKQISLETGTMAFFAPARNLYSKSGFHICPPFADYQPDPNSIFMTKQL